MQDRRFPAVSKKGPAVVLLAISVLIGCSSSPPAKNPYADRIAAARNSATSAFERAVLADGRITKAEFMQAENKYVTCLRGLGYDVTFEDPTGSGIGQIQVLSSKDDTVGIADDADATCSKGTTVLIAPLYSDITMNPKNLDIYVVQLDCLKRSGLAPKSYTLNQYKSDAQSGNAQTGNDAAFPFNAADSRYVDCLTNPSRK